MNQSLLNLKLHSYNDIDLFQKYELCQQQSKCYLLIPPPQLPIFPKLIPINSSSTLINLRQHTHSLFIIPGIFIALIFICFLLLLLAIKFQFYHKLCHYYRQTKVDRSASFSNIIPTSNSLTPLTITTNQSPLFTIINNLNLNLQQHSNSNDRSSYRHHCSCTLASYQLTPYYYTYDLSPSRIVCQNCLFDTLHKKQQCLCHNFFVPIK